MNRNLINDKWRIMYFVILIILPFLILFFSKNVLSAEGSAFPFKEHIDQKTLADKPFIEIYKMGEKLFNTAYNSLDGVGANLSGDHPISIRFSRVPRADLPGFQANPIRVTGPSAARCADCHEQPPKGNGSDGVVNNEPRDPFKTGDPSQFIMRGAPHIFGSGALQLLAEEATVDLKKIKSEALIKAELGNSKVEVHLITFNKVNYGKAIAYPTGEFDTSMVQGINGDLVVKPYQLKGSVASLRLITLGPADNSLGMQPVEFFGWDTDFDDDGVTNEFTVGDITVMMSYIAAQPRPTTKLELHRKTGGKYRLSKEEVSSIKRGEKIFSDVECVSCHVPRMELRNSIFQEPSKYPEYRFAFPPSGIDPIAEGLDPSNPVKFDLVNNPAINCKNHRVFYEDDYGDRNCFLQFKSNSNGGAFVELYGDLKYHDMGLGLAESVDEVGTGISVWKTRELWGAGSTAPWLHDGRATTLDEAILWHGGEAKESRDLYAALNFYEKSDLIRFLKNLVLFDPNSYRHERAAK